MCIRDRAKQFIATSGEDLIQKLKGNPSFIFTLIHKFNKPDEPPIIPDHDIIILSDEAHRTQNGIFADNMCTLLPTASRIGFTGTPLFAYDNICLLYTYYGKDILFVKIPDMHGVIYPLKTEVKLSERGANTQKNKLLPPKSIMVSCIATVGLVCIAHEACQTNQQINSIILNDEDHLYYMFFKMKGIKSLLEGVGSNGATMTNVNKTKFENIELLKPENEILKKFNNLVEPFFSNILALSKQNEKLKEARDKLLSKLMSGEIEV